VTLKVRRYDFTTHTRSLTLAQGTDDPQTIARTACRLLAEVDTTDGVRLLGVGVSGLTDFVQGDLFGQHATAAETDAGAEADAAEPEASDAAETAGPPDEAQPGWRPGQDLTHDEHGPGWVWGSGRGLVTVRFEGPRTAPGPVRSFAADDPALHPAPPPIW
jgi:DNA polymerase IV